MKKCLSLLISLSLLWTSGNGAQAAALSSEVFAAPSNLPQFQLAPPRELGRIVDYFNAQGAKQQDPKAPLVIFIQDLHAHYGVQKKISALLDFLAEKLPHSSPAAGGRGSPKGGEGTAAPLTNVLSPKGARNEELPFALAVEGASGPVDSSLLALFPEEKVKLAAADFLMREGELTGAEYFAIQHGLPQFVVGAENEEFYTLHRDLFRKTIESREALVKALAAIQTDISVLPDRVYGPALKPIQKKMDAFEKSEITTEEFIGFLTTQVSPGLDLKQQFPALAAFSRNGGLSLAGSGVNPEQLRSATAEFFTNSVTTLSTEEKKKTFDPGQTKRTHGLLSLRSRTNLSASAVPGRPPRAGVLSGISAHRTNHGHRPRAS